MCTLPLYYLHTHTHTHSTKNSHTSMYVYVPLDYTHAVRIYDDSGHLVRIYIKINEYGHHYKLSLELTIPYSLSDPFQYIISFFNFLALN